METLAARITLQGRTYRQLKREGMAALYEVCSADNMLYGFEVIWIRVHKAGERFGKWYPEREGYPCNEDWGTYAWTYLAADHKGAEGRFDEVAYRSNRPNKQLRTESGAS